MNDQIEVFEQAPDCQTQSDNRDAMLRAVLQRGAALERVRHGSAARAIFRYYGDGAADGATLAARYPKTFRAAVRRVLPMLCERGSWNYAEAWVRDDASETGLKCIATFK